MHVLAANTSLSNTLFKTLAEKYSYSVVITAETLHMWTIGSVFPSHNIPQWCNMRENVKYLR